VATARPLISHATRAAASWLELRPPSKGRTKAFVSHAYGDEEHFERLEQSVNSSSWELKVHPRGDEEDWRRECEQLIRDSDAVICLVGKTASHRSGVDWEIRTALSLNKPLVAAYVGGAHENAPALAKAGIEPEEDLSELARSLTERVRKQALFGHTQASGPAADAVLIEQYKALLETSENLEARRQTLHTFFMSINTLFLGAVGLVAKETSQDAELAIATVVLALFGFSLCGSWRRLIDSYKDVRKSKFDLIQGLETHLPAAPFVAEWISLSQSSFVSFTNLERKTPMVFQCLYVLAALAGVAVAAL